jgi:hypothetical protein
MSLLDAAAASGDPELIRTGLLRLGQLDRFQGSAPRGAQTWEVPLHTPDILASAYLVRAYTLGYALSGDVRNLDRARYWAWTGVPFIYLTRPLTDPARAQSGGEIGPDAKAHAGSVEPVGLYSTIAVFGATQFVAPNWMGRPVQWCGLVYADALYRLLKYDPDPFWKSLADGITVSGMQQTWPRGSDRMRQGLLPDSFSLRAQTRNDPAINPGTLEADAIQLVSGAPLYDMQTFHAGGIVIVHAPGRIKVMKDAAGHRVFKVDAWPERPYDVLVVGLKKQPRVWIDGKESRVGEYDQAAGSLVLHLTGKPVIELDL